MKLSGDACGIMKINKFELTALAPEYPDSPHKAFVLKYALDVKGVDE